jgi:chromatin segregation and condensation protein Rec8/ScpA/Scc1 (kleisin family)
MRQRGAWTSTFVAGLELAKQGEVALAQADTFASIRVSPASSKAPD